MLKKQTYTLEEARKKLENYCVYQERCHQEVRQKLQDMRMIPEAADTIIVYLLQHNFLNEERFAKAYVTGKFRNKKWGKRRLILELERKDVSKTIINLAIKEIDEEIYYKTFNDLVEKQFLAIKEKNTYKKKRKLFDYLAYRGWESDMIYDKLSEIT